MSECEFNAYQKGEALRNTTDHRQNGEHTTSVGFCFFTENPDDAIHWLRGIVNDDVCCTFECPDNKVRKSSGIYCDHEKSDDSWGALFEDMLAAMAGEEMPNVVKIERTEYCCTRYSNKDFRLVDYKYSKSLLREKRFSAMWERQRSELTEGMLLQGITTEKNMGRAMFLISKALGETPLQGKTSVKLTRQGISVITLPDGRVILPNQRVEVHADGVVLIDGKLLTYGFPRCTRFCTGTGVGDNHWYLCLQDGSDLEVPEALWKKYNDVLRNRY